MRVVPEAWLRSGELGRWLQLLCFAVSLAQRISIHSECKIHSFCIYCQITAGLNACTRTLCARAGGTHSLILR